MLDLRFSRVSRLLYQVRWKIILAVASALVAAAVAEILIRALDPLGISYFQEATRYHLDKIPDPALVFKHAPNLRRVYQGVEVRTNELGLRDRELRKKQMGGLRILLLGDSVTLGWGAPIEYTFGRKLEPILASKLRRPVETVNAGVGAYNTVQEFASLRAIAGAVDPDLVALLYVANDTESNDPPFRPKAERSFRGKSPVKVFSMLLRKSRLYRLVMFSVKYAHPSAPAFNKNAQGVQDSMSALASISDYCRERNIPFLLFFYRSPKVSQPTRAFEEGLLSEIREAGSRHGFPVIDTNGWWDGADMRSLTNSAVDSHPNARGHELLAKLLAESLAQRVLSPRPGAYPE